MTRRGSSGSERTLGSSMTVLFNASMALSTPPCLHRGRKAAEEGSCETGSPRGVERSSAQRHATRMRTRAQWQVGISTPFK